MSFKGLRMLKIPKLPDFEKYWKSSKNIQRGDPWKKNFFSFLFNTLFYTRQSYKTIRMSFGGLRMLKSPKLTQCYSFASVFLVASQTEGNNSSKAITKCSPPLSSLCPHPAWCCLVAGREGNYNFIFGRHTWHQRCGHCGQCGHCGVDLGKHNFRLFRLTNDKWRTWKPGLLPHYFGIFGKIYWSSCQHTGEFWHLPRGDK